MQMFSFNNAQPIKCPRGHQLAWSNVSTNHTVAYKCAVCTGLFFYATGRWMCISCQCDVCPSCGSRLKNAGANISLPIPVPQQPSLPFMPSIMYCRSGHALAWSDSSDGYPNRMYKCEKCNTSRPCGEGRWKCFICKYDICGVCRPKTPISFSASFSLPVNVESRALEESKTKPNYYANPNNNVPIENKEPLELERFKDSKMASIYVCPICLMVPHPSMAVEHKECGKIYCRTCIEKWAAKSLQCPNCKQVLLGSVHDKLGIALTNAMNCLVITCSNVPLNSGLCNWENEWDQLPTHQKTCAWFLVQCPNACGARIYRKDMPAHLAGDCPNGTVPCSFCGVKFKKREKETHESICEKNMEAVIACEFQEAGCKAKMKRKDLAGHLAREQETHMDLMWKYVKTLKEIIKTLESERSWFA